MPLVDSLLTAVVRSDGDALVLHVGEKPYVVAAAGPVELSKQGLGLGAMEGMLAQLLSADALRGLRELGAVEHELEDRPATHGDRFTVVAARGGDDIWIELRRHRRVRPAPATPAPPVMVSTPSAPTGPVLVHSAGEPAMARSHAPAAPELVAPAPAVMAAPPVLPAAPGPRLVEPPVAPPVVVAPPAPVEAPIAMAPVPMPEFAPLPTSSAADFVARELAAAMDEPVESFEPVHADEPEVVVFAAAPAVVEPTPDVADDAERIAIEVPDEPMLAMPDVVAEAVAVAEHAVEAPVVETPVADAPVVETRVEDVPAVELPRVEAPLPAAAAAAAAEIAPVVAAPLPVQAPVAVSEIEAAPELAPAPPPEPVAEPELEPELPAVAAADARVAPRPAAPVISRYEAPEPVPFVAPEPQPTLPGLASPHFGADSPRLDAPDAIPAVVLSLTRDGARTNGGASRGGPRPGGIERLLRLAAARGASALYLTTQARPAVRVDGDIRLLDGEPALSSGDVEAAVLELAPDGARDQARDKESAEWIRDLADVGRVRITTFRDYRGPGALLRMISAKATSAEQLGLVREIQALATEPEGLVIVTGPRASGKSTMMSAFVDLINRQRNDYVITLEGQIRLVHESRGSLISQREVRGAAAEIVTAARTALRENPDVLVIEDLRSPDVLQAALDAAGSGLLVFVSVTAASATAALERLVDLCPSEQRRNVRAALAEHLRGVVAQVLLRKSGGGRLAARELVLNTSAVAALVGDGQIAQLPRAIDSGRKLGMAPLNDALVAFVQSGAVDVREAYRKADDKAGLLGLLRREGIDTSFVERLA